MCLVWFQMSLHRGYYAGGMLQQNRSMSSSAKPPSLKRKKGLYRRFVRHIQENCHYPLFPVNECSINLTLHMQTLYSTRYIKAMFDSNEPGRWHGILIFNKMPTLFGVQWKQCLFPIQDPIQLLTNGLRVSNIRRSLDPDFDPAEVERGAVLAASTGSCTGY